MTEREKQLIAHRLKTVSRKELIDILTLADFKVESIERLNLDTNSAVENVKSSLTNNLVGGQILSRVFDISEEQGREILKKHLNTDGLSDKEIVERICEKYNWTDKLQCIRDVKSQIDIGLKEAKDLVDECFIYHKSLMYADDSPF